MPSKGPTNTTVTQRNAVSEAQLPFLTQGWNQAKNLYETIGGPRYYPGQTMAPYAAPSNYLSQGYQGLVDTARANDTGLRPQANAAWFNSLNNSGVQNSPAVVRQDGAALLLDERQEWAVPRGLPLLLAVEGFDCGDFEIQHLES